MHNFVEKNFCAFPLSMLLSSLRSLTPLIVSDSCSYSYFFFLLLLFACFIYFICLPIFHIQSHIHIQNMYQLCIAIDIFALRIELQNMKMHKNHANIANQTKMTTQNTRQREPNDTRKKNKYNSRITLKWESVHSVSWFVYIFVYGINR